MQLSDLSLSGYGYLQEVIEVGHHRVARIYCHCQKESEPGTAFIIVCHVVDQSLKTQLTLYQEILEKGHSVIVKFTAHYLETTSLQRCSLPEETLESILCMNATLLSIAAVYVDGVRYHRPQQIPQVVNL